MHDLRNSAEGTGRSVDEAVRRALEALGVSREAAEITILDEGSRGLLGIGAREARVRAERRTAIDSPTMDVDGHTVDADIRDRAASIVRDLLMLLGFTATVDVEETPGVIRLNIRGDNLAGLIGRKGLTLKGLESLVNLMVGRKTTQGARIELDAGDYWQRRQTGLEDLARRTAERVARRGREIALSPMDAHDRRIIHVALQGHPQVTTSSRGEGDLRRVVVVSRAQEHAFPLEESRSVASSQPAKPSGGRPPRQAGSPKSGGRQPRTEPRLNTRAKPGQPFRREGPDRSRFQGNARPQWRRTTQPGGRLDPAAPASSRSRPEGLPSDEELEAEIQAHLERISKKGTTGAADPAIKEPDNSED